MVVKREIQFTLDRRLWIVSVWIVTDIVEVVCISLFVNAPRDAIVVPLSGVPSDGSRTMG